MFFYDTNSDIVQGSDETIEQSQYGSNCASKLLTLACRLIIPTGPAVLLGDPLLLYRAFALELAGYIYNKVNEAWYNQRNEVAGEQQTRGPNLV